MPLDARDGGRAAKMRAGLPTRADNRAGSAPGRDRAFRVDLRVGSTPSGELNTRQALVLAPGVERSVRETSVASRISSWVAFGVPKSKRHEKASLSQLG